MGGPEESGARGRGLPEKAEEGPPRRDAATQASWAPEEGGKASRREKGISWAGEACREAASRRGAWELEGGGRSRGLGFGLSRSLSGGLPGPGRPKPAPLWSPKRESGGEIWVPRKGWKAEGNRSGSAPEPRQVWVPRQKGPPADVWVHQVRDPSGAGMMWVWAKVTNCGQEEDEEEEGKGHPGKREAKGQGGARLWASQQGPGKEGRGGGRFGVP